MDTNQFNWASATPQQLADMSRQLTSQGVDQAQQARMAQQAGVSLDNMNMASMQNGGFGRMAIDNAYMPGGGTLNDSQQMWNAQHSGAGSRNEATGGDYAWNDVTRSWNRPTPTGGQNIGGTMYYGPNAGNTGSGGSANLGMGGVPSGNAQYQAYQSGNYNPYLKEMGNTIVNQMTDNYNRNQLPAMRSGAMAAGGFGGSRQGVVDANGLRDLNLGIGQNLTNLYGTDWTNAQNRNLTQQQITNQNNQFGTSQDNQNAQFGATYGLNVLNAQNNWANQGVQATTNMQNTPANYAQMFGNMQNQIAGQGSTSTGTQTNTSNPWVGAIGGLQLANQWLK